MHEGKEVGKVFSFFNKIMVAAVLVTDDELVLGDKIRFKGPTTDFEQEIESMQMDGEEVQDVQSGKSAGIKVNERVRPGDKVYKLL